MPRIARQCLSFTFVAAFCTPVCTPTLASIFLPRAHAVANATSPLSSTFLSSALDTDALAFCQGPNYSCDVEAWEYLSDPGGRQEPMAPLKQLHKMS